MENSTDNSKTENKSEADNVNKPSIVTPISESINGSNKVDKPSIVTPKSESKSKLNNADKPITPKKAIKPPKLEDKPFDEFITNYFIPGLKKSILDKGTAVNEIKLIQGNRPVVGGKCWMVFCKISNDRKFWLCFNKDIITSDKTILLAESNSDPSIVESFLIDEKKTTLPLLISRVLQRLNGQKWIGVN